ncbi:hypothetical protein SJ05684_c10870 [Sinorhizobium sojae CCBAU 05684]|uniref:Uncharacterized protein n=1 Tax=Sinorhizobium sojae CCBAU 05684 TaxID=716928 RepID=A0A249PA45_9HYPH|nr:hypothetical protein [Sinorhizobium sojae]ASY62544.1 hypothetical protein SJ05684_c10870 [Sinorhizobium sojae CCBAU 05684]
MARFHIRVTKNEDGSIKRELMREEYKIADVSKAEIIDMLMQFSSSLRYD